MRLIFAIVVSLLVIAGVAIGVSVHLSRNIENARQEERKRGEAERAAKAKALHEEAMADSEAISRGMKAYWQKRNGPLTLQNDTTRLKNDQLEYDIAKLEGHPISHNQIDRDIVIINNDKLAMQLSDPETPTLDPHEVEKRILEHNRKYPNDQLADIADINKEMDDFDDKIRTIIEQSNDKLREKAQR